jgi:trans-aconitate methyltransferase
MSLPYTINDNSFEPLFPEWVQKLSFEHWTPFDVADEAAAFLAHSPGLKILDIGSGIGKFCLLEAKNYPQVQFDGIEQRLNLHEQAVTANNKCQLRNINFMHGNFTHVDFKQYQGFYFYNSIYENLEDCNKIDDRLLYSQSLYEYYSIFLRNELEKMPSGTRVVTYKGTRNEIPFSYQLADSSKDGLLRMWKKE